MCFIFNWNWIAHCCSKTIKIIINHMGQVLCRSVLINSHQARTKGNPSWTSTKVLISQVCAYQIAYQILLHSQPLRFLICQNNLLTHRATIISLQSSQVTLLGPQVKSREFCLSAIKTASKLSKSHTQAQP